ncbi:ECF transporter S component [Corynebacterium auriscanis]|uniref:ECF transporter S component n=1 Tax=Corynebacterium auriscanis TaxID=99807 RepID=UPI002246DE8F|nr:ECF transporter S component [Corynebacterium auriscanis]MCX2162839.1 ECF transporter S component [Corynebacterium auriscanis]
MTAATPSTPNSGQRTTRPNRSWRVVDIVVAAILGVAFGLIFWIWNGVGGAAYSAFDAATPGLGGLATGIWVAAGVVGGLIIRKPGAALFVELVAAIVSALLGNQWGIETVYSGLAQGLGAELAFLAFGYRKFTLPVAVLAGIGAEVLEWILELFTSGNLAMSPSYLVIYLVCMVISGAVLAGVLGYFLVRGLAATGALDRFAAGRERREEI